MSDKNKNVMSIFGILVFAVALFFFLFFSTNLFNSNTDNIAQIRKVEKKLSNIEIPNIQDVELNNKNIDTKDNNFQGVPTPPSMTDYDFIAHPTYPDFAEPYQTSINGGVLRISDRIIYDKGYYVRNGEWQEFDLGGSFYPGSSDWLIDSANVDFSDLDDFSDTSPQYVLVYSCSLVNNVWDCHENMWQLNIINNNNNESEDKCIKIFGEGNPEETLNIFILPVNYPSDELVYEKPYDLDDFTVNFENDVNRLLFSANSTNGYGLLMVEPFTSNLDKISVFIYPIYNYFEPTPGGHFEVARYFREKLSQECIYYEEKSFIHLLIGEKQEEKHSGWIGAKGSALFSGSFREKRSGYGYTLTTFRHELGHQFGAGDTYESGYKKDLIETYNNYYSADYDDFWVFYDDWILGKELNNSNDGERPSSLPPNCALDPGCSAWCEGEVLPIGDLNPCAQYDEETTCNDRSDGRPWCTWYPSVHPYFESQCVPDTIGLIDIGTNCKEGTGCYYGCMGRGFRSHTEENLAAQWIDNAGRLQGYDVPTRDFINDVLHCCHPSTCDEDAYDYSNCEAFRETYENHRINNYDRYTGCFGCV